MFKKSKKNRSAARYMWKEKHRKQYTFTKTKFAVGFSVSVFFSVFMGSYFDQFGRVAVRQMWEAFKVAAFSSSPPQAQAQASPLPQAPAAETASQPKQTETADAAKTEKTPVLFRRKTTKFPRKAIGEATGMGTAAQQKRYFREDL